MNWLAHALLSEDSVEFRLGNVLADLVKGRHRKSMTAEFLRGVRHHQKIDTFTDTHALHLKSRSRISDQHRRFSGILIDIFYDHFLARDWQQYAPIPLNQFTSKLYDQMQNYPVTFTDDVQEAIDRMIADDRLGLYGSIAGIENTLQRINAGFASRVGRDFQLHRAIHELTDNYDALEDDFCQFFPMLMSHIEFNPACKYPAGVD